MGIYFRWLAAVATLLGVLLGAAPDKLPGQPEPQTAPATEPLTAVWAQAAEDSDAAHVFVYDPVERKMLYCSGDPGDRLFPASITKLFTAWLALRLLPGDRTVTVGWELGMLEPGSSSAFLSLDSQLTVEDLIRGMLLPSGNDAALVLAAAAGRVLAGERKITAREAVALFVEEMNRAAEVFGMDGTHFENPHGCHGENHYSCPEDLGLMAALALEDPLIRQTVALSGVTVTAKTGQVHTWTNTNRLVRQDSGIYCPDAMGLKTGYTDMAGYCLMAAFGGERPLVVGIFGSGDSESRYETALALFRSAEEAGVQTAPLHGEIKQRPRE